MKARKLSFRLYIEGVAIKFISGSVNIAAGSVASASISIPFSKYCTQLRPRSIVTITYSYGDDKNTDGSVKEYILFEGDFVSVRTSGSSGSRECTLTATSPLASLRKYRKYIDHSVSAPILSAGEIFLNPDSKIREQLVGSDGTIAEGDASSTTLLEVLKDTKRPFPAAIHEVIKSTLRAKSLDTREETTIGSHESLYNYMDSFEVIDMLTNDNEWGTFRESANFNAVIQGIHSLDGLSNPDYYTFMSSFYTSFNYTLTDLGVPHLKVGHEKYVDETTKSLDNSSRFLLHPTSAFLNPPTCNIILPDIILASDYQVDYSNEITRASLVSGTFFSPEGKLIGHLYPSPSSQFYDLNRQLEGKFLSDSSELDESYGNSELFLGTKGFYQTLPVWYTAREKLGDFSEKGSSYIAKYSNLFYLNAKYSNRGCSVSTVFNPKLCAGLPACVLDTLQPYFTLVASVTHSFNRGGSSVTSMRGSHVTLPLDYLNPDLREASGMSPTIYSENIGKQYIAAGLGDSFYDFSKAHAGEGGFDGDRIVNSIINTLERENRKEGAETVKVAAPEIISSINKHKIPSESTYSSKMDEGIANVLGIEVLLDKIRSVGMSNEALESHLNNIHGRAPVIGNIKENGVDWAGEVITQEGKGRGYWFNRPTTDARQKKYRVRREAAEKLAAAVNSSHPEVKSLVNIENSVIAMFSDTICPKTEGEKEGMDPPLAPTLRTIYRDLFDEDIVQ